jgi:glycosyltransferase involved in cell wall biosynthesis
MRVLFINRPDAHTNYGGDTMQMERTAAHLRDLGIGVTVSIGAPTADQIEAAEIVHLFNLQTPDFTWDQLQRAKAKKTALSTIWWDFAADEVFRTSNKWEALRKAFGTRRVRPILQKRMHRVLFAQRETHRKILKNVDILLPNSPSEADQLKALAEFETPIHIVANGVDLDAPEDLATAKSLTEDYDEFILIAARVEPVKNQLAYMRAVAPLGIPVLCAGAPTEPYAQECQRAGATILGRQTPETTRALYRLATLHALPSLRETPGLSSLEAAAAGTRILSTDIGSALDYFGTLADYCDPHDSKSMLAATKRALARKRTDELKRHVEQFTWRLAAEKTLEAYNSI